MLRIAFNVPVGGNSAAPQAARAQQTPVRCALPHGDRALRQCRGRVLGSGVEFCLRVFGRQVAFAAY